MGRGGQALTAYTAADLTVVIPTRDRWGLLARCLQALRAQTVTGFEVTVVVDGDDQVVPDLEGVRTVVVPRAGPGVARNAGVAATSSRLILFLGDDIMPTSELVATHLALHQAHPEVEVASLGHVAWHPEVASTRLARWLDWSATQFDFRALAGLGGQDVGWGRFVAANACVKRELFDAAGGFDPEFFFLYEDIELGWRLGQQGMRLLYAPGALGLHVHRYDWPGIVDRFDHIARSERLMLSKHPGWFQPFFLDRMKAARDASRTSSSWTRVVDLVPPRAGALRRLAEARANRYYYARLAPRFLDAWEREGEVMELREYLGARYDQRRLWNHRRDLEEESRAAPDEEAFYRSSEAYLYDLTVFSMSRTKDPYIADLRALVAPGARVLDYGCGIGSDGLRLIDSGYDVAFADYHNPSTRYLRWRLERRGVDGQVYDVDGHIPGGFDAVYAFDVIEHVDDAFAFLARVESLGKVVVVNLLESDPQDVWMHRDLPIDAILAHARSRGLLHYARYHDGRSHLVAYRSGSAGE